MAVPGPGVPIITARLFAESFSQQKEFGVVIRTDRRIVVCFAIDAAAATAQNRLAHYDGTPETVSRGTGALSDTKMAIQRIPADQACGATRLREVFLLLQDQNTATFETITVQVRKNNP